MQTQTYVTVTHIKEGLNSCDVEFIKDRYVLLDIIKANASEVYAV